MGAQVHVDAVASRAATAGYDMRREPGESKPPKAAHPSKLPALVVPDVGENEAEHTLEPAR